MTDGHNGRQYYDLGGLEATLADSEQVSEVRTYMTYDKSSNEMKLIMDALPEEGTFVDSVRNRLKEQCGDKMLPAVVNIIIET